MNRTSFITPKVTKKTVIPAKAGIQTVAAVVLAAIFGLTVPVSAQEQTVSCCIFFPRDGGGALACGESKPRDRGDDERRRLASEKCDELKNEFRATKDVRFVGAVAGSSCRASPACAEPVPIAPLAEPDPTPPAAAPTEEIGPPVNIEFRPPLLSIPIPGIPEFSNVKLEGPEGQRYYIIPWLAQYLEAIYRYALSIIGVVATVMVVYGGIRWLTAAGNPTSISAAKKTITEAVIGLILALGSYLILFTINPEIVKFRALQVAFIEKSELPEVAEIDIGEGEPGSGAGGATGGCAGYVEQIRSRGLRCEAGAPMPSPTGRPFSCNYHTAAGGHGDPNVGGKPVEQVTSLDVQGSFGTVIKAPAAGRVKIGRKQASDCIPGRFSSCAGGNSIKVLFGNGYSYNIVHVFEFLVSDGAQVQAGDSIAKVGGQCCSQYNTDEWKTKTTWTGKDGKKHFWSDTCRYSPPNCAAPWEVGNSTGPHTHVSITKGNRAIPLLPCFEGVGIE